MSGDLVCKYNYQGLKREYGMPYYTGKCKEQIVRKMMSPNTLLVADANKETGISGAKKGTMELSFTEILQKNS